MGVAFLCLAQTTRRRITDSSAATDQELRLNEEIDCEDGRSALGCNPGVTSHRHQLSSHQPACPDGTTAARRLCYGGGKTTLGDTS